MLRKPQSKQDSNKIHTRRNAAKVEQYLSEVERTDGFDRAWELRLRLEGGHVSLRELRPHR